MEENREHDPDFLDVQEFLVDGQKFPCRFKRFIPDAGHLEGTTDKDIQEGTTLDLPYWLASKLCDPDIDLIDLLLPPAYTSRVRNALAASADSVNLRNLGGGGGAFYAGGARLNKVVADDGVLAKTLDKAFRERMVQVMDQSQHTLADMGGEGAAYEFCQGLDSWERQMFQAGEQSAKAIKMWYEEKTKKPSGGR